MKKQLDPFGVFIIAFVTAVGGGTLRDMLLADKFVFWLLEPTYIYYIIGGTIFAMVFRNYLIYLQKILLLFDTIGLGLYTIAGVQIGISSGLSPINCLILGTITGSFGGVIRDILVNEVPVIFRKEIYATASILGGVFYLILLHYQVPSPLSQLIPIFFIILFRFTIIYFNLSLPVIPLRNK